MKLNITFCNLNVTEVRDSDLKKAFPGIFNFTVGILTTTGRQAGIIIVQITYQNAVMEMLQKIVISA